MTHPSFLREDKARTERWAHLTEGLEGHDLKVVETLMENTASLEAGTLPVPTNEDATTTGNVSAFNRVAYPLIRRIYPGLIANQLISIQPATLPAILVFYLDFKYGTDQAPTQRGDRTDYEAGQRNKWFASGVVKGEAIGEGDGTNVAFNTEWYPLRPDSLVVSVDSAVVSNYTVDEDTGAITFAAAPADEASITADYALIMEALGTRGNSGIPEVELDMTSAQVGMESKKLKAKWTIEVQQDLQAYHGLGAENELVTHMGDEIKLEIDRMVLDDLREGATAGNVNWDQTIPTGRTVQEHNETLIHAIGDVSTLIYKKRLRHANFVVCGPDTINKLDKINSFRLTQGAASDGPTPVASISSGPNVMGTLAGRYRIVVDPLFPANKILVGYKGSTWFDTGYVFAPYVSFQTQTFIDPNTMVPVKGLMSRFGRHLINGDFYGTVTITAS